MLFIQMELSNPATLSIKMELCLRALLSITAMLSVMVTWSNKGELSNEIPPRMSLCFYIRVELPKEAGIYSDISFSPKSLHIQVLVALLLRCDPFVQSKYS
jgi:hypothetical protein